MVVPVDVQLSLFSKILTFDRNLKTRVGEEIVVGIVYQGKFRKSLNVKDEIENFKNQFLSKIDEIPVRYVSIDISEESDLANTISKNSIDILYITPVRALDLEVITIVSRTKHIITLTGVPDYVESGLSVGIGVKGGKPQIMINLSAAKAEGIDFNSKLLNLAKVVQ
jgi:hypothetical protein